MRFGKRLAEVTQSGSASEPYIAYKELKHTVSKIAALIGAGGSHAGGASSEDEEMEGAGRRNSRASMSTARTSIDSSIAASAGFHTLSDDATGSCARVQALQRQFFRRIDTDVGQAKFYVQNVVAMLEASVGEWQTSAIFAGFLFTPEQLEEVASTLPFQTQSKQALVEWLTGLQADSKNEAVAQSLIQKYNDIATILNEVLQYIEVNLTAIRKIFKKFEKKLPQALRIRQVCEYTAHHDLFVPAMQHLLVAAMHMQRIICGIAASQPGKCEASQAVPLARLGPESMSLVSFLRGPPTQDEPLSARIDVYAKPSADGMPATSAPGAPRRAAPRIGAEGEAVGCSGAEGLGATGVGISINAGRGKANGQATAAVTGHNSSIEECDATGGRGRKGKNNRGGRGRRGMGQPGQGWPPAIGCRGHPTGGATSSGTPGFSPRAPMPSQSNAPGSHCGTGWGGVNMATGVHVGFGQLGASALQGQFLGAAQVPMYVGKGGCKGQVAWPHHIGGGKGTTNGAERPTIASRHAQGDPGFMPMMPFFWPGMPLIDGGE